MVLPVLQNKHAPAAVMRPRTPVATAAAATVRCLGGRWAVPWPHPNGGAAPYGDRAGAYPYAGGGGAAP